jgi:hypothetical protein
VAESARRARTAEAGIFSSAPSRLDPMSAWEVLGRINAAFDRAGIVYLLTGWFASAYHRAPRSAQDIDIATAAHPEQSRRFFSQEEFGRRRWSKLAQSQPQIEPVVAILKLHWKSLKPALPGKMDFRVKLERGMEQCYTPGWNL